MAKKIFNLEQVLGFRREIEKRHTLEFAAAKEEFESAAEKLRAEEEQMDQLTLEIMDKQIKGINACEMQMYSNFMQKKQVDITTLRDMVWLLEQTMAEKRAELLEAAKDKKAMELLKDKKVRNYMKDEAARERGFLDELSLQRKGRGKR